MTASRPNRRQFTLAAGATLAAPAFAQSGWPAKPVRIVVPYTPGGFTDQMARLVQAGLTQRLGQPVIIDNKPGANSLIGVDAVAKAAPDGQTFGVVIAAYAANTTLYPKLPYDPAKDLLGVSLLGVSPLVAAVNNDAPFKTAKEVIAHAKANPGKVSFGSSGNGSAAHLTTELWKALTGTYMIHIPYRGAAPALADLMGGQIQLFFDDSALVRSLLTEIINRQSDMECVGSASDPLVAREMIRNLNPDVITLDVEMPRMDGIDFLSRLMRRCAPCR